MENINNIFETLNKQQTYSEIANLAEVSRNTVRNVRDAPENVTLKTLRKVFRAMGYDLILGLKKVDRQKRKD